MIRLVSSMIDEVAALQHWNICCEDVEASADLRMSLGLKKGHFLTWELLTPGLVEDAEMLLAVAGGLLSC